MPTTAPRVLAQLGYAYPYAADGNDGPPVLEELVWGVHASERVENQAEPAIDGFALEGGLKR